MSELLEDYEDFAMQQKLTVFPKEKSRAMREIRDVWGKSTPEDPYIPNLPNNPEVAVNLLITLINQANYLLDRQIASLERNSLKKVVIVKNCSKEGSIKNTQNNSIISSERAKFTRHFSDLTL